jgi:hypothetical protein
MKISDGTASARRIVLPHAGQTGVPRWGEVGSGSWVCGIACGHKQKVIRTNNTARAAEVPVKLGHCGFQIRTKGSELGQHPKTPCGAAHDRPTGSPRPCHCGRSKTLRPPKSGAMVLMLRSPHTSCRVRAPNAARHFLCLTPPSPVLLAFSAYAYRCALPQHATPGFTVEYTMRHERGHCHGWGADHLGARPVTVRGPRS